MSIEHIRLPQQAKDKLLTLKRRTGIKNWNVLCRWAFCVSLADPTAPSGVDPSSEGAVEMTWRTFGGAEADVYEALLLTRCEVGGLGRTDDVLAEQLRLHLLRGIGNLAGSKDLRSIEDLISLATRVTDEAVAGSDGTDLR